MVVPNRTPRLMNAKRRRDQSPPLPRITAEPPLAPNASAGKRWRFRRNLVIYVAHRQGLSQRLLADVFDLPRSRIAAILQEYGRFDPAVDDTAGAIYDPH